MLAGKLHTSHSAVYSDETVNFSGIQIQWSPIQEMPHFFFLKDPPPPEISPLPHPDPLPLSRRQMEGAQAQFGPPHRSGGPHTECGLGPGGTHCRDRDRRRTAHGLAAAAGAGHHGTAATPVAHARLPRPGKGCTGNFTDCLIDRKSTRLNSSHLVISYAVFCLKKKKKHHT